MGLQLSRQLPQTGRTRLAQVTLVFAVVSAAVLLLLAHFNAQDLKARQNEVEGDIVAINLDNMQKRVEDIFQTMYQNGRTISLLPGMQALRGGNRSSLAEDVVASGRFNPETDRTVQQIFNNLYASLAVSEVYAVLDGFDHARGDLPFFMFDVVKLGIAPRTSDGTTRLASEGGAEVPVEDAPEVDEEEEYAHFPSQLQALKTRYPVFKFSSVNDIPAVSSPLLRTCDNTQYYSKAICNVRDASGLLYSIPFYHQGSGLFSGVVSVIVRANVLESALVGVPFLVLTPRDEQAARAKGFSMPADPSAFALVNEHTGTAIADRRNHDVLGVVRSGAPEGGKLFSVRLNIVDQSPWMLHYYLTPQELDKSLAAVKQSNASKLWAVSIFLLVVYAITMTALTLQLRASSKLRRLATVDALTGLPNRNLLVDRIRGAIARSKRLGSITAVFFVDLNKFKFINDSLGHSAGDLVLQEVGRRMLALSREVDTVSRLGGDEFVMVCEVARQDDVNAIGGRLVEALSQPITLTQGEYSMGSSVGIALFPLHGGDAETLLRHADIAMYQAKKDQATVACVFDKSMQDSLDEQLQLQEHLRSGIAAGELVLHFQPQVEFATGKLMGFEALVRWQSSIHGFLPPVRFIPLAEECGLITQIDDWVMNAACAQINAWRAAGLGEHRVSINMATTKFVAPTFLEDLEACLLRHRVSPSLLELEITESLAMVNPDVAIERMQQLRDKQVELAIDDFGTGYSNLSYLSRFPATRLKIDQRFVRTMLHSKQDWALVATIVELARSLNIRTVAEGVETLAQAQGLYQMGVHEMQGYWVSKPLAPSLLISNLTQPVLFDPEQLKAQAQDVPFRTVL